VIRRKSIVWLMGTKRLNVLNNKWAGIIEKAAGNSFIVMIYLLLAIGWYSDNSNIDLLPTDVTGIGILGGSVSFAVFWVYFNSRPNLE
jgi:hypothetical protein